MCFDDNENSKVGGEGGGGRLHAVDVVDDAHAEERVVEDVSHLRVRDTTPHRTSQHAPASQPSAGGRAHEQAVLAHAVPDRGLAERPRRDLRSKIRRVRARRETRSPGAPPIPALAPRAGWRRGLWRVQRRRRQQRCKQQWQRLWHMHRWGRWAQGQGYLPSEVGAHEHGHVDPVKVLFDHVRNQHHLRPKAPPRPEIRCPSGGVKEVSRRAPQHPRGAPRSRRTQPP